MRIIEIFNKIKKRGVRWFLWRCHQEIFNPSIPSIKRTVDFILRSKKRLQKGRGKEKDEYLYAIFDLEICPITFNIGEFLCSAEIEASKLNKKGIILLVVPAKNKNINHTSEYEKIISADSIQWRLDNIVLQVARLHLACKGINFLPDRLTVKKFVGGHDTFPDLYDGTNLRYADLNNLYSSKPYSFRGLRAKEQGKRYVKQYLDSIGVEDKIVTLIVRDYGYDKARNSNQEELSKFIEYLILKDFHPIVIPDTDSAFEIKLNIDHKYIFRDCCWNVGLRLALYELSLVNIFGPGGAGSVMLFDSACPCILINAIVEDSIVSTAEAYAKAGIYEGCQWSFLPQHQFISYKKETCENLVFEFESFLKKL